MLYRYFNRAQAISSLAAHLRRLYSFFVLALLVALSACSSSEPELRFSESFIGDHNFTVALNSAGDGLNISFNSQSDASYELLRSSSKDCTSSSTTDACTDYFEFQMLGGGSYADSLPERTYYYKLAVSLPGISEDFSAQYPPLDPPGSVTASAGDKQITLSWRGVSGASSYNLYGARVSGVTPENYASLEDGFLVSSVTSSHVLTDLTNGATYYLVLTAINADGVASTYSDEVNATPVTPASDNVAPVFTSASAVSVPENTTSAFYTATATDANGDFVSYSISGGADSARFSLDATSGALRFINAPDYENPSDGDNDNIYNLSLLASDGVDSSAPLDLTVSVSNLTELSVEYNLSADAVIIDPTIGVNTPEGASIILYRADEPIGTATCSVLDGISSCTNGASWADGAIPSSDTIDWSLRRYYQLDISADGAIVDRVFADLSVSDYLTMNEPIISDDSYEFNLSWQALPNIGSYSLYVSTDANATSATAASWSELTNSQIINDLNETHYLLDPDSNNTTLYFALSATNSEGVSTDLAPLHKLDNIDHVSDGSVWFQTTASAGWSARNEHTSVVFDDKLWVIGGYDGSREDDVWYSADGVTWNQATATAGWSARHNHTSVVFDDKLWVIGGYDGDYEDDVWHSADGITWTRATATAGWSARSVHTSVVFDDKLWVIGGSDGSNRLDDVWHSADGITWTQATATANWSARRQHTSVVFDDKLWVIGGDDGSNILDDVWYSDEGITWIQATADAGWLARDEHSSVIFDDQLWIIGGYDGSNRLDDVWHSADGINWQQSTAAASWSARDDQTSVVFNNKLWVLGGYNGSSRFDDVWYSPLLINTFNFTPLDYDYTPPQNQSPAFTSANSATIDENSLKAYTATGTDPDDATLAFTIAGGADFDLFTIDASSGELAFLKAPDYENPADSDADNVYQLNLQLSDGSAESDLEIQITIVNVIEAPPAPTGLSARLATDELRLSWDSLPDDTDGDILTYNLYYSQSSGVGSDGHEANQTGIGTNNFTFDLSNFDTATTYYFAVSAQNEAGAGEESEELSVLITTGIDNSSPVFSSVAPTEILENTTGVFYTASISDADGDDLDLALSGGDDAALFSFDTNSGELLFIDAPDYESPSDSDADNVYSITLSVSDAYYITLQTLNLRVADMAAEADFFVEYNSGANLIDISFKTESELNYQLLRSYEADCDHQSISACSGGIELAYNNTSDSATATDSIDFDQTQYYQLLATDAEGRIELLTASISGAEQLDDFASAHQLFVEYNLSTDAVDIHLTNFPDAASYDLHRAQEPIGTATCSVLDGISACANGASWSDTAIPNTDTIDWSARNYYQLDISVDDIIIDRITTDLSVSDYLTMAEPTVATDGYQFDLRWQALPDVASYSLYIATDADATSATKDNWSNLEGSEILTDLAESSYRLDPSGNTELYLSLSATNTDGTSTSLAPLYQLNSIDYVSDGSTWIEATDAPGWSARREHTSVVFDDKLWVLGGNDGSYEDDVWYSENGISWTQATDSADWSARMEYASLVFNDKLWVLGAYDGSREDDVWYSEDGIDWNLVTDEPDWTARNEHTSIVFDGKLWMIGGYDVSRVNDVWHSENGISWTQATENAGWLERYAHTSAVFDDKLWVIGGTSSSNGVLNDVWYSENGVAWIQATEGADWLPRYEHTSVVFNDKLWVIGGYDGDGGSFDDAWYSDDGFSWTQTTAEADWQGRYAHTSVVFDNKLWVLGGYDSSSRLNDVWYSPLLINTFNFTPLDYAPLQNQSPTFTSASSVSADENNLKAYTATGNDPDGGTLAFAIIDGTDAALFSINPSSGELHFLEAPDYEAPADSNGDNTYQLALQLSDGSAEDELDLLISVSDVIDNLSSPTGLQATVINGDLVLSWQIVSDANSYRVYWDTSSSVSIEQYSDTLSADSNSVIISGLSDATTYYFVVTSVNDQGESPESAKLKVLMNTSVDNSSPIFTSIAPTEVSENTANVFYTASASDSDSEDELIFAISGGADAALFAIGSSSGELLFIEAPDYENPADSDADNIYSLTLSVSDTYATTLQQLAISVADMAANADFHVEHNANTNLIDISFNTESDLSYQLLRSYEANCDYQSIGVCAGGVELVYSEASGSATATDSIDFGRTQYYQLLAIDAEERIEFFNATIDGAEQLQNFITDHQLIVEYNLNTDEIDITLNNLSDAASYTLYRAEEPMGTETCSVLDGIDACTKGTSWSDSSIPSTDTIDWSARNYYQLNITLDAMVIGRLFADLAVSDYLTMEEPTVASSGVEFNISWQALPNVASYNLYIATDADATSATKDNWSNLAGSEIINGLTETSYLFDDPDDNTTLYFALNAIDGDGVVTELAPLYRLNDIDYVSDGSVWVQATDAPDWSGRNELSSTVFDDKLWILGGYDGSNRLNEVWYSENGTDWIEEAADWPARYGHTSMVLGDQLWVIGGYDGGYEDDVWHSDTGVSWVVATTTANWVGRHAHSSVVFDSRLWVLGGDSGSSSVRNDVWYSADGETWVEATATTDAGWTGRSHHSSVVFEDMLWMMGGYHSSSSRSNDIWRSNDGLNWEQVTANASWSERFAHTSTIFDDKIWVLGGRDSNDRFNDIWYSEDGINWVQAMENANWSERDGHASVVFNKKLWVLGGYNGSSRLNDVWYSPLIINTFNFTSLNYDYSPLQNQTPTFTSATSTSVSEKSLEAYTATGDDPDNGTLAFAIAGGADAELFTIDSSSGELSFLEAPDYENPADSDTDNNYTLTLQLHDGSADSELDLVVSVTDFIEIPPAPKNFSAQLATSELRLSWEDLSANYDVGAVSYNLYYATSAGVNADNYAELGGSVEHSISDNNFTFALSDLTADTMYHFAVSATNELGEGEESDELSVLITSGVDNSSPLFTSAESAEVIENTITAFYTATASDADADDLAFAISGGADAALFSLDPDSGELSFIVAPDYEAPTDSDADNIYSLTLSVSDAYATALHSLSVSITDMAVGVNLQAEYNSSANLVDISFNTESDLDYQLFRSYDSDCAYQSVDDCSSGVKLDYAETDTAASTTDTIDFAQTQYYQLVVTDSESRTEIISTAIVGAEQLDDFAAAHQLLVEYNLNNDLVDIHIDNFPDAASYTLHRAQEPIGTETCSVLDGISGCANGTSWSDSAIPSTDTIDWSARNYYQLDISVDDIVIDRLTADLAVSDYLTMAEPTVATDGYQFNLSWQALPNVASYSLYIATDADATSATKSNWVNLEGSEIITDLATASYLFDPDGNSTLYLALSATNSSGTATALAPLYQLNSIDYISDGSVWVEATDSANWSERIYHSSAVFNDKLWVIGGHDGSNRFNEVWYSKDGVDWTEAATPNWSSRRTHVTIVFDGKLWVLGGDDGSRLNDVWYSEDGASWTEVATAGWSERHAHRSVVFDDKLWVLGGHDGSNPLNDVWYSDDGEVWNQATTPSWSVREYHTSLIFKEQLWVLGGWNGSNTFNDVWYSEEGATWEQATEDANWSARSSHTSVVFDDKIWVLGGYSGGKTDVWYSEDGTNWTQATAEASWSGRYDHTSVVFRNKLWVLGGWDGSSRLNDVWYSPLSINTFNFTPLDYDYAPPQNQAPTFTSTSPITIDENTIDAYTATGTDSDGGTLAFTIAGGADAALFSIDPSSGELSFLEAPDYENPADSNADNSYELILQLHDGSAEAELDPLLISISNVIETLPAPQDFSVQLASDELRLGWASVPDNLDGGAVSYNLYYGTSSGVNSENHDNQQSDISDNNFTFALSDFSADTKYHFVVSVENSASESPASGELSVLITSGVDNSSPLFTSAASAEVFENTTTAFYTASASDADNDALDFALSGGADATLFSFDLDTGELRFIAAPDYENPNDSDTDNIYSLTLSVSDAYATALQSLSVSVADMAADTNLQAEYNLSVNRVDLSFNTESDLSYQLQRSYDPDCDHLQPSACAGYQELAYTQASNTASATDNIDFTQTQYYQLLATDAEGRTELITTSINGAEHRDDFAAAHQLLVEYNLSTNAVDIHIDNFPEAASYTLYRAQEPLGTATCSVIDGISGCTNGASWSDTAIPSTDAIDWSARNYYQLDISVDDVVIDRLTADLAVSDYLTMSDPTVSTDGYEFNLSWQALPNVSSYSLYIATDANATGAVESNWSSLAGAQTITAISRANYSLYPNGAETLYLALTATDQDGTTTNLAPLYQLNSVDYSVDASIWRQATDVPGWSSRSSHSSTVFDDKLWVIGGNDGGFEDDIWYSDDGAIWHEVTAAAEWTGRRGHSNVIFNDQIWIFGGYNGSSRLNSVWYSADGGDWDQATTPGWGGREYHTSLVFKEQLWLLGGYDGSSRLDEVWYSADGAGWLEATATTDAGWVRRSHHSSAVFKDKLWILGGYDGSSRLDDIWHTEDGSNWELATAEANWSARNSHTSVVFDDKLWVLGGYNGSSRYNDVWFSYDGINWTQATANAAWSGREVHTSVVFKNQLWVLGGYDGNRLDDVWYSPLTINNFNFTPIDYDYAPARNQAPAFTSATSAIVDENTIDAYTATGTDPDDGTLAFTIAGGADAALFVIDSSSGKLSFSAYPDYENPADSDANNAYQVNLGIHDGSAAGAERSVSITVLNETESPTIPVIVQAMAGDGEATLNWQAVNDADGYRVYWSTNSDLSLSNFSDRQDTSSNSATISNLSNDTIYYFFVTAVNSLGESAESSVVSVKPQSGDTNQAPTAAAGADQTVSEGKTVYLVGSGSDADGSIVQYTWSSASSSISIVDSDSSDGNASFTAPEVGPSGDSFTLTLRVTDDDDASGLDTMTVTVENNEAPTVNAGADQSAVAGTTVNLKGSASDSDGTVVAYSWQETSASSVNSGGVSISRSDSATASITVPELDAGDELTFELTATDDDGSSASAQTKLTIAASGSFKWSFATGGSIYSSPAIALDGSIYFGSDDGKLYALHPDGSEDWNYTTGDMVRSAPAIGADGSIYFGSDDNKLYALNPDGSENWNYPTSGVVRSSPALAADGSIYFGSDDGKLYALNPDGSEDWNYTSGNAIHSAPTISSEGMIYFGDSAGVVHELNSSGDVQRFFASAGAIYTSVALDPANDQLYFSNRNGNIYALSTASSASWDNELWSVLVRSLDSAPVLATDSTIYIGSSADERIYALDVNGNILSGRLYSNAGAINATGTLGADARIYFSSGNGNLYALDISSATETRLDWEYNIGWSSVSDAPAASAVAIARDGTVYVGSTDGKLYALHSASAGLASSSWPRFAQDNHNLGRINIAPSAEAGSDQDVAAGATVNLDGSSSSDSDGAIVDYYWQETSSFGISITNNSSAQASFTAPDDLSTDAILSIQLTITDNSGATATDTLQISVPAAISDPVAQ